MPRIALFLSLLLALPALAAAANDQSPPPTPNLVLSAGAADIFDSAPFACATVNYRPAFRLLGILGPDLMAGTGRHHEFYAAAGIFCDLPLVSRLLLVPSFGLGYYNSAAHGRDLGFDLQFCTSLQLAWRFAAGPRLGMTISHLSNGSLSDFNPGTESLTLSVTLPLKW